MYPVIPVLRWTVPESYWGIICILHPSADGLPKKKKKRHKQYDTAFLLAHFFVPPVDPSGYLAINKTLVAYRVSSMCRSAYQVCKVRG